MSRSFRPSTSKTTRHSGSHEMRCRYPATAYVRLAHCSGLLRSSSPLGRRFLRIGSWQHWLGCLRQNGLSQIVPYPAQIIDRSLSSWLSNSQKSRDESFCNVCRRHLIDYSLISTVVSLHDVSVNSRFGRFSRLVFLNGWTDRLTLSSSGHLPIHRSWVPSIFVEIRCEDLADRFIQVQLQKVVDEDHAEYLPTRR